MRPYGGIARPKARSEAEPRAWGRKGGRLVKHARYYWLLLAESHLTGRLFGAMVQRIVALTIRAG